MENLSGGWVGRPRADGYGVVGKRGGRSSKTSGCRLRRLSTSVHLGQISTSAHLGQRNLSSDSDS